MSGSEYLGRAGEDERAHYPGVKRSAVEDLREWLGHMRARGLVREVRGAEAHLEVGAITDLNAKHGKWVLLFDEIGGYDPGFRILTGALLDAAAYTKLIGEA